jgi:hypothetical protein
MKIYRRKDVRGMQRAAMRVLVGAGAAAVFVIAAVIVEPDDSRAVSLPREPVPSQPSHTEVTDPDRVSLGELIGFDHRVHIVATPEGPRYTALDNLGNVIAAELYADELYHVLPNADVKSMIAGPLMRADIRD